MSQPIRRLGIAAGVVIVALTAGAFALSYAHLHDVAASHGLAAPWRAWAWPGCLDAFIVAGELLMLRSALLGRTDWWAIGLTASGSLGSIALNVAGVGQDANVLDHVVAAVPPTAALLAFGALMRQVHQALHNQPVTAVETTTEQAVEVVTPERAVLDWDTFEWTPAELVPDTAPAVVAVPAERSREVVTSQIVDSPAELRRKARKLHQRAVMSTGRPVTIDTLREELGMSRRDAADLRRELVEEVAS